MVNRKRQSLLLSAINCWLKPIVEVIGFELIGEKCSKIIFLDSNFELLTVEIAKTDVNIEVRRNVYLYTWKVFRSLEPSIKA